MALYYLVRHGEANYDDMFVNGFWGFGRDFAPLSEKGRQQAEITAKDARLNRQNLLCLLPTQEHCRQLRLFQGKQEYESKLISICMNGYLMSTISMKLLKKALHLPENLLNLTVSTRQGKNADGNRLAICEKE